MSALAFDPVTSHKQLCAGGKLKLENMPTPEIQHKSRFIHILTLFEVYGKMLKTTQSNQG